MSSVPRHSEEELRQQWAFLDALVDRQAASLKSGVQDPEEEDAVTNLAVTEPPYLEEISRLTRRITTLEDERDSLLRRIDLAEEARIAAETGRASAEAARLAAEQALADQRTRLARTPTPEGPPRVPEGWVATPQARTAPPNVASGKSRRKSWWQRIRE